jgi:hypothetical protein
MVEFVEQHSPEPSVLLDLYPNGGEGIHHVAMFVDDLQAEMRRYQTAGLEIACYAEVDPGLTVALVDTCKQYGHFIEMFERSPIFLHTYSTCREAAVGFDNRNLFRTLPPLQ